MISCATLATFVFFAICVVCNLRFGLSLLEVNVIATTSAAILLSIIYLRRFVWFARRCVYFLNLIPNLLVLGFGLLGFLCYWMLRTFPV